MDLPFNKAIMMSRAMNELGFRKSSIKSPPFSNKHPPSPSLISPPFLGEES